MLSEAKSRPRRLSGGRTCKECGKRVWKGKSYQSFCRWVLRLCRYCDGWKFPERERRLAVARQGSKRLLTWTQRREMEQAPNAFGEVWSPRFRREMKGYFKARMRGEV